MCWKGTFDTAPMSALDLCVPRTGFWVCLKCYMEGEKKDGTGGGVLMVQPPPSNCTVLGWLLEQWDILGGAAQTRLPSFAAICSSLCKHSTALGLC